MNGAAAIYYLLTNDSTVTDLVADRIVTGILDLDSVLPAIAVSDVSGVDLQFISDETSRFTTERVQVTAIAKDYPSVIETLQAAKRACDAKRPTVEGTNFNVRTDGQGPYFTDDVASLHMKTQDFRVTFTQDA